MANYSLNDKYPAEHLKEMSKEKHNIIATMPRGEDFISKRHSYTCVDKNLKCFIKVFNNIFEPQTSLREKIECLNC